MINVSSGCLSASHSSPSVSVSLHGQKYLHQISKQSWKILLLKGEGCYWNHINRIFFAYLPFLLLLFFSWMNCSFARTVSICQMHDLTTGSAILVYVADTDFYLFAFLYESLQFWCHLCVEYYISGGLFQKHGWDSVSLGILHKWSVDWSSKL